MQSLSHSLSTFTLTWSHILWNISSNNIIFVIIFIVIFCFFIRIKFVLHFQICNSSTDFADGGEEWRPVVIEMWFLRSKPHFSIRPLIQSISNAFPKKVWLRIRSIFSIQSPIVWNVFFICELFPLLLTRA